MAWSTLRKSLVLGFLAAATAGVASAAKKDLNTLEKYPSAPAKVVRVDGADLDVSVRTADIDSIEAEVQLHIGGTGGEKAQRWIDNHTPTFSDSEGVLDIVVEPGKTGFLGFGSLSARAHLGLIVPGEVIPDLTTTSGRIELRGDFPNSDPLRLRSSTGDLVMTGAATSIDISTAEGDVQIEVLRPLQSFVARTSAGDVSLVGGTRSARVDTASGRIWLQDLSGSIDASTSTGKITLSWDRLEAGETVRIRSSSGRVQIIVPDGVQPQGTLTTTTGSIHSQLPGEIVEDGTALKLSGNGPVFDVETASGEIQLTIGEVWN
jgi:DUF4097 and DUF4098 domain-containing protein YvlB